MPNPGGVGTASRRKPPAERILLLLGSPPPAGEPVGTTSSKTREKRRAGRARSRQKIDDAVRAAGTSHRWNRSRIAPRQAWRGALEYCTAPPSVNRCLVQIVPRMGLRDAPPDGTARNRNGSALFFSRDFSLVRPSACLRDARRARPRHRRRASGRLQGAKTRKSARIATPEARSAHRYHERVGRLRITRDAPLAGDRMRPRSRPRSPPRTFSTVTRVYVTICFLLMISLH